MVTATATKPEAAKGGKKGRKKPVPHDDVATPVDEKESTPVDAVEAGEELAGNETEADSSPEEVAENSEPTEDKKLRLTREEKERLEKLLCDQSKDLDDATVAYNASNEETKERKKRMESRQANLEDTARSLTEVLEGRWKPDPQGKLPFKDQSGEVGSQETPSEVSSSMWRSTPLQELVAEPYKLAKSTVAKLEEHGFTTLGAVRDEIEVGGNFESLDGIGDTQVKKIHKALDLWFEDHRIPDAADPEVTEEVQRDAAKLAYELGCAANADGKPISDNPYKSSDERFGHWNDGWNETENA